MTLPDRDRAVVNLAARFRQVSSTQIRRLVFTNVKSATPADRTLKRLVARGYLHRIEHRMVGGAKGGSGQYSYELARQGYNLYRPDKRYQPSRAVNYHALAIVDCYISFINMHDMDVIELLGVSTEPDCHTQIGEYDLRPDLYVELQHQQAGTLKLWLEVDMGTESQKRIREKVERYWNAYNIADGYDVPEFPTVVFVAVDDYRANELRWLLKNYSDEKRGLFRVMTPEELATSFL